MGFCSICTDRTLCPIASPMTLTPGVVTLGSFPRMCHVINQVFFGPAQGPMAEAEEAVLQGSGWTKLSLLLHHPETFDVGPTMPPPAVMGKEEAEENGAPKEDGGRTRPMGHPDQPAGPAMPPPPYTANPEPEEQEGFWQVKKLEGRETEAIAERVRAYTLHPESQTPYTFNPEPCTLTP